MAFLPPRAPFRLRDRKEDHAHNLLGAAIRVAVGAPVCAAFVFAMAALGLAANDPIVFAAPAGWIPVPASQYAGHTEVIGAWTAPEDVGSPFRGNINVVRSHSSGSIRTDVDRNLELLGARAGAVRILWLKRNNQCPKSGQIVSYSLQTNGYSLVVDQAYTASRQVLYVATYTREASQRAAYNGEKSIESLCPRH